VKVSLGRQAHRTHAAPQNPRQARYERSWACVSLNSRLESEREEEKEVPDGFLNKFRDPLSYSRPLGSMPVNLQNIQG
jgi:hypothetical protein